MHAFVIVVLASGMSPADASAPSFVAARAEMSDTTSQMTRLLHEIAERTRKGMGDDVIIDAVRRSCGCLGLTGRDIVWLHEKGVHDCVIDAIQAPPPPIGVGFVIHGR